MPEEITGLTARRFKLGGKRIKAGRRITLPANQFEDLKLAGVVIDAPVKSRTRSRKGAGSSAAASAAVDAELPKGQ